MRCPPIGTISRLTFPRLLILRYIQEPSSLRDPRTQGIVSAPEPSHAIHVAIEEALKCKETGEAKNILFLLCGHGYFDMSSYDAFLAGNLEDFSYPKEAIEKAMESVPQV